MLDIEPLTDNEMKEIKRHALSIPVLKKLIAYYETSHDDELHQLYINSTNKLKRLNSYLRQESLKEWKVEIEIIKELIIDFPKMRDGLISLKGASQGIENMSNKDESEHERQERLFPTK